MKQRHLTPHDLAERWSLSEATLAKWRWNGKGPTHLGFGGRILYRISDVELFEAAKVKQHTTTYDYKKKK